MPPLDRRDFLKTVAVVGAAGSLGATGTAHAAARYDRTLPAGWTFPVAEELLPFGHGVMSGDPLADRVVLWTRLTIPDARGWDATKVADPQGISSADVRWVIARDPALRDVVRCGKVRTDASRDWTVKIDADRLPAASTLFYAFEALGFRSPIGRTRTAPAAGQAITEMTVAHVACTSWWQDVYNSYARIGERDDLDLVTHAGDYVYETCGGHPASRFWADQRDWDGDLDNRNWQTLGECRRRYALNYADPALLRAHLAAPFAIMADNHDYESGKVDGRTTLTTEQAGTVFFEWSATRAPLPDGSGRFPASPGPDVNLPAPTGRDALFLYRSLPYGDLGEVLLLDVRRFADVEGQQSQVLGDQQWAWLERALLDTKARGIRFRYVVNGVNLSQLRAFNLPAAEQFREMFGIDPNAPQGEIYTSAWGGVPEERNRLFRFLRANDLVDNVVMSGDSHGWFGSDLVEDAQLPNYEPTTGGGLLGAVGVELVPSAFGRPGGQDVLAETAFFARTRGSRGAAFDRTAEYDSVDRPAVLAATLGLEAAGMAANPNLLYFNWKAEYGHALVHLREERAVLEAWTSPQRVVSTEQRLLAQFSSPVGAPHLGRVLQPSPVQGSRQDARPPEPATVPTTRRPSRTDDTQAQLPRAATTGSLPATGPAPALAAGALVLGASGLLAARRRTT